MHPDSFLTPKMLKTRDNSWHFFQRLSMALRRNMHRHTACGFHRSCFNEFQQTAKSNETHKKISSCFVCVFVSIYRAVHTQLLIDVIFTGLLWALLKCRSLSPAAAPLIKCNHLYLFCMRCPEKFREKKKCEEKHWDPKKISSN